VVERSTSNAPLAPPPPPPLQQNRSGPPARRDSSLQHVGIPMQRSRKAQREFRLHWWARTSSPPRICLLSKSFRPETRIPGSSLGCRDPRPAPRQRRCRRTDSPNSSPNRLGLYGRSSRSSDARRRAFTIAGHRCHHGPGARTTQERYGFVPMDIARPRCYSAMWSTTCRRTLPAGRSATVLRFRLLSMKRIANGSVGEKSGQGFYTRQTAAGASEISDWSSPRSSTGPGSRRVCAARHRTLDRDVSERRRRCFSAADTWRLLGEIDARSLTSLCRSRGQTSPIHRRVTRDAVGMRVGARAIEIWDANRRHVEVLGAIDATAVETAAPCRPTCSRRDATDSATARCPTRRARPSIAQSPGTATR